MPINRTPLKVICIRFLFIFVLFFTFFNYGCKNRTETTSHLPSVLLLSIDTLRFDSLGCCNNQEARTPNIDKLANSGVLFENAMSQSPATGPSFSSILTSKYPIEHGVLNSTSVLSEPQLTMAEIFKAHDYRTSAFVSCGVLNSKYGFSQGFDVYNQEFTSRYSSIGVERDASHVTNAAISWLSSESNKPFFMWLHYFDTHAPYRKHESTKLEDKYGEHSFLEKLDNEKNEKVLRQSLPMIKRLYADEVAFIDTHIGRIIDTLKNNNQFNNTLIIVISDHGEELYDHEFFHGHYLSLYESVLHVPLIFHFPKKLPGGIRISQLVESIDILPTVMAICGMPLKTNFSGHDLSFAMEGQTTLSQRFGFSQREPYIGMPGGVAYAVRDNEWKYIYFYRMQHKLFNLITDPEEKNNLIEEEPEQAAFFSKLLKEKRWTIQKRVAIDQTKFDAETQKVLKSLGYIR